ncbi:MAG: hypothetical protein A3I77_00825 [Gammaproteobacteria bacterium RIFCSPLOWO2_02_FULL_42_14]|nr:MAG: hypothetical protein A3B71_04615 [Gammaproteobacteria bacterium RIFCSPHIGHO2_02_FULL_42_43]OGT27622.1 MAG: hypothetical protein A2624_00105 [Gammaproteobacteria bacterium RIFCSPHIGHO2_01_FULL_42_8]OGT53146.1 MAG: hypothetical protein A3E54_08475 [Gammaproteobacteria bacterium RIFCSPHIGHO2_12_FULL_41_25]OGT60975.1 MAG: hypothetical protein A3I77_00825 [Gammaproteobacteria bacterium RIFCSPLOWO2_02_FULL_42_14]OGT85291.1 MAG: hypothetical protein A3G86_05460 [Gammaproteobacteria bacterium R
MSGQNSNKLNNLLATWQNGTPLLSNYLKNHGYYRQLVNLYCKNEWIKSIGHGAYTRLNDPLTWQGAVNALQTQLSMPVHIGGLTALELHGVSQYVSKNDLSQTFYLYRSEKQNLHLPTWFSNTFTNSFFEKKTLFNKQLGLSKKTVGDVEIIVSAPERAILEVLSLVPYKITLEHANELMELLDRLRSDVMQKLLESCTSIKVKRLFLYLSEKHRLSCFNELNLTSINIGSGNRVIGNGGHTNKKWMLSLSEKNEDEISRE